MPLGMDIGLGLGVGGGVGRLAAGPGVGFGVDPRTGRWRLFRRISVGLVLGPAVGKSF